MFEISLVITWLSVIFTDSGIPGAFSRNMLCKVVGPPIHSVTLALIILIVENCWKAIVYFFRPGLVFQLASPVAQLATSAMLYLLLQNAGSFAVFLWIPFLLFDMEDEKRRILEEVMELDHIWGVWEEEEEPTLLTIGLGNHPKIDAT